MYRVSGISRNRHDVINASRSPSYDRKMVFKRFSRFRFAKLSNREFDSDNALTLRSFRVSRCTRTLSSERDGQVDKTWSNDFSDALRNQFFAHASLCFLSIVRRVDTYELMNSPSSFERVAAQSRELHLFSATIRTHGVSESRTK